MAKTRKKSSKQWSAKVTKRSNALDLEPKVFRSKSPRKIAVSLKRSAERSKRRKAKPYQSAMSMLNFYINRAGKNLPQRRKRILEGQRRTSRCLWESVERWHDWRRDFPSHGRRNLRKSKPLADSASIPLVGQ
jgi:Protein of unknown function (DUF3175)